MNTNAYLYGDYIIFLWLFSIMSVEGAKSIKPSFFHDLTPSTVTYEKKHKNIKL